VAIGQLFRVDADRFLTVYRGAQHAQAVRLYLPLPTFDHTRGGLKPRTRCWGWVLRRSEVVDPAAHTPGIGKGPHCGVSGDRLSFSVGLEASFFVSASG
jgi:hypothetical protein